MDLCAKAGTLSTHLSTFLSDVRAGIWRLVLIQNFLDAIDGIFSSLTIIFYVVLNQALVIFTEG